jgi:excisionase family DNA binding protein
MDDLMRVGEAAKVLRVHSNTLRRWIAEEKIVAAKTPGGHYRIARREVDRILNTHESETKTDADKDET